MGETQLDLSAGRAGRAFVGRLRELGELRAAVGDALAGRGRLVLVAGEPGIGKTRLAEEACAYAAGEGALVLGGRCWEGGGAPAFWPWVQIIRSYARGRPASRLAAELGAHAPFVVHLVPELLPDVAPAELSALPEEARFALLDAVTEFLTSASASAPLVLVLDDLHAADEPSLLLLRFLARELPAARILVLGTYRDIGAAPAPGVAAQLGELVRDAHHVTLRGLGVDDVARYVAESTGSAPTAEVAASIHDATGGNPLFLAHVVGLLAKDGRFALEDPLAGHVPLPPGVREAIRARVAMLPGRAANTLTIAAVVGGEPSVSILQHVSGLDLESLLADLGAAVDAALLVELADRPGRFHFAHDLIREALHEDLDAMERSRLHREVGRAIELLHGGEPGPHVAVLAHHFCRAALAGDTEPGVRYAVRAAERALALLAYEDAAAHYELALTTLELAERTQPGERCDLLLGLGDAEQRAGRAERSREILAQAAALARGLGDAERLARAAVAFGAAEATIGEVDEAAVPLLEEALAALPAEDSPLRARALARLARALYFGDAPERRAKLSRQAVRMARSCDDPATLLEALCAEHVVTWSPDNSSERLRSASEIVELAERLEDREVAMQGHLWRRRHLLELGDALASEHESAAFERLASEVRQPRSLWLVTHMRAGRALLEGRLDEAERLAREALEIGRPGQGQAAEATFLFQIRVVRAEQGRLEEVAPQIDRLGQLHAAWRVAPLYHLTKLDRKAEVRALFERLAARDFADLPAEMFSLWNLAHLAEACVYLRDRPRATRLYDLLLPYRDHCLVMGYAAGCEGAIARYLGSLAAMLERWDDAAGHFERALEIHTRLGARPLLAHTQHEYAAALLERARPEDRRRAHGMLTEALTTAEELGLTVLAAQVRDGAGSPQPPATVFRKDAEYWTIAFGGSRFRLKDRRGLAYLAHLLARPNEQVHVLELVTAGHPQETGASSSARRDPAGPADRQLGLADAGELLDAQAKTAYRRRHADLREELEQAEAWGDPERAARASAEIDFLTRELARAVGLHGRDRRASSPSERARVSATKAIKRAVTAIAVHDTSLGDHLALTIRTGTFCSYTPGVTGIPAWETASPAPGLGQGDP